MKTCTKCGVENLWFYVEESNRIYLSQAVIEYYYNHGIDCRNSWQKDLEHPGYSWRIVPEDITESMDEYMPEIIEEYLRGSL